MDDLCIGICWYDDPSIFRLLDSLPDNVKKIIVDGKFLFNPSENRLSSEELRSFVLDYKNVELIDAPDLMEHEKRNVYLDAMNDYEFGLMIDSDEYVIDADWNLFYDNLKKLDRKNKIHGVRFYYNNDDWTPYPRVWIEPSKIRYYKTHNIFLVDGSPIRSPICKPVDGISIGMDDSLRSEEYLKNTSEYQKKMLEYEMPLRRLYREGRLA